MKGIVCIIAFFICALNAYYINDNAASVIHQVYSGLWGVIATLFICTGFIIGSIEHKNIKSNKKSNENKKESK